MVSSIVADITNEDMYLYSKTNVSLSKYEKPEIMIRNSRSENLEASQQTQTDYTKIEIDR